MTEKRFIVESVMITNDCNEDKSRIVKVITDKEELYSYADLYEINDLLNEQQERTNELENINEDLSKFIDYAGLRAEFFKWLFSIKEVRVGE